MGTLKQWEPGETFVEQAFAVLLEAARNDPDFLQAKLAEAARRDPSGIKALLKAAGLETFGNVSTAAQSGGQTRFPVVIGQPVTEQGIPFSHLTAGGKSINLNLIPDYLRDPSGTPVALNGDQAVAAIRDLNGGAKFGDGYEKAITRAVARGEFMDGALILARRSDLLALATERQTNPGLKQMNEIVSSGSGIGSWCVSSTEDSDDSCRVRHVRLRDGYPDWGYKHDNRSRVVVLRGFAAKTDLTA